MLDGSKKYEFNGQRLLLKDGFDILIVWHGMIEQRRRFDFWSVRTAFIFLVGKGFIQTLTRLGASFVHMTKMGECVYILRVAGLRFGFKYVR